MSDFTIIELTPESIGDYGVCGYKDVAKHVELRKKIDWYSEYYERGLRIKVLMDEIGGYQGMVEYIPGKYAHRPVDAEGYLFIHCLFVGFRKEYKGKGYATALIEECLKEAKEGGYLGVATVTRKGSFMADDPIFVRAGFEIKDSAKPDFHLMAFKFKPDNPDPKFKKDVLNETERYGPGLVILRSPQCPYSEKNVRKIMETAKDDYQLDVTLVELEGYEAAASAPNPFGTFCILLDGEIITHHPISDGRFRNILDKRIKGS
jgi:GNAT superfamily N-acetyltransferase